MLIVCSDGVWEFISSQEAVEIVQNQKTEIDKLNKTIQKKGADFFHGSNIKSKLIGQTNGSPNQNGGTNSELNSEDGSDGGHGGSGQKLLSYQECAEVLAKESWDRWTKHMMGQVVDDITAVIIKL